MKIETTKVIIGLSLLASTVLYAGDLERYVKKYEPEAYRTLKEKGVDLKELEAISKNDERKQEPAPGVKRASSERPSTETMRRDCQKYGDGVFLENRYVATCISGDGTLGNGSYKLGLTFNPKGTGTVTTPDYLQPGTPFEYFSIYSASEGLLYTNNNRNGGKYTPSVDQIPTKVRVLKRGTGSMPEGGALAYSYIQKPNLKIIQKYTLDPNSRELIVRVEVQNLGKSTVKDLYYARGIDPDQERPVTFHTWNRRGGYFGHLPILSQNIAQALGYRSQLAMGIYSVDPMAHNTCISRSWTVNPMDIYHSQKSCESAKKSDQINYSDSTINIAFKLGTLKTEETKVFSFKYLLEKRDIKVIKDPKETPKKDLKAKDKK